MVEARGPPAESLSPALAAEDLNVARIDAVGAAALARLAAPRVVMGARGAGHAPCREVSRMLLMRPRLDWKPELLLLRRPREGWLEMRLESSAPSRSELYE